MNIVSIHHDIERGKICTDCILKLVDTTLENKKEKEEAEKRKSEAGKTYGRGRSKNRRLLENMKLTQN